MYGFHIIFTLFASLDNNLVGKMLSNLDKDSFQRTRVLDYIDQVRLVII